MLLIGLMSGTSLDGVDAALVACTTERPPVLIATTGVAMPAALRQTLWRLCHAGEVAFETLASAEEQFCQLQAQAVGALLERSGTRAEQIAAIGSHGQTIEHRPEGAWPYTCQLDNPSRLAELTGCTVVGDFRRRDIAAGGQGAPLAPAFHEALFRDAHRWRVLLNLGGFANLTILPPHDSEPTVQRRAVIGFDTGPANALMDGWYARHHDGHFDADGAWAATGSCLPDLLERMLSDPFFSRPPPKSTGREHFNADWLEGHLSGEGRLTREAPRDVQATLAALTVESVARALSRALPADALAQASLIPCGGGAHNRYLIARLAERIAPLAVVPCETLGWSPDWLEAGAFAWLAWRRLQNLPGNAPTVTGAAGSRVLGGLYHR